MSKKETFLGLFLTLALSAPMFAGSRRPVPLNASFINAMARLDHEPQLAPLIQREYGTREEELRWAAEHSLSWGEITALAYIQATTGRTFAEMIGHDARQDFWTYAENAGMNCEKMAR